MTITDAIRERTAKVYLYYQVGLKTADISDRLSISTSTVDRDLARAFRMNSELQEPDDAPASPLSEVPSDYKPYRIENVSLSANPPSIGIKRCPREGCGGDLAINPIYREVRCLQCSREFYMSPQGLKELRHEVSA